MAMPNRKASTELLDVLEDTGPSARLAQVSVARNEAITNLCLEIAVVVTDDGRWDGFNAKFVKAQQVP
jgi:hypothetical protein